jgi:ankyrin repeat protein
MTNITQVEKVTALAIYGCCVNTRLESGYTPLSFAVRHRNLELIKALLKFGANPTHSRAGRSHFTPLDDAILDMKHGEDTAIVDLLLSTGRCLINRGKDPLHTAFSYVLRKAAKLPQSGWERLGVRMLQSVKDVNKDRCALRCSLLHVATLRENIEFIDIILSKGADIEAIDELGVTPLIMACQRSPKLISILIERGADIEALYKGKSGVLAGAASYGNVESMKILTEIYERDIEAKTEQGLTPLACALIWGEGEAALYLIEKGANVHWQTQDRAQTALHFAAKERLTKVVEELLKKGVDMNARDIEGWMPLHEVCTAFIITLASLIISC